MTMRDRIKRADPIVKALIPRIDDLIAGHNELVRIVLGGQNPHKVNDVTNVLTLGIAKSTLDQVIDLEQELITQYGTHLASTTHHRGADSTNTVTELGVPKEIYALLDELKVDYEAHRVIVSSSIHAGTDAVNVITAANATTKALAFALANDLKVQFIANFANVSIHHGVADTNVPTFVTLDADSTWAEIATAADDLRATYEAHRILIVALVHGAPDSTNTVTAAAVGTVQTAVNAGLNELKGDFNAHIQEEGTFHFSADTSMLTSSANASSLATSITLVNEQRLDYIDHISRAAEVAAGPIVKILDEYDEDV